MVSTTSSAVSIGKLSGMALGNCKPTAAAMAASSDVARNSASKWLRMSTGDPSFFNDQSAMLTKAMGCTSQLLLALPEMRRFLVVPVLLTPSDLELFTSSAKL